MSVYELFSVLSGLIAFAYACFPDVKAKDRVWAVVGGVFLITLAIVGHSSTSGTTYFPVQIFFVPPIAAIFVIVKAVQLFNGSNAGERQHSRPTPVGGFAPPTGSPLNSFVGSAVPPPPVVQPSPVGESLGEDWWEEEDSVAPQPIVPEGWGDVPIVSEPVVAPKPAPAPREAVVANRMPAPGAAAVSAKVAEPLVVPLGMDDATVSRSAQRPAKEIVLRLADGSEVPIGDAVVVVGRNPVAEAGETAVRVSGAAVSKTHFAVGRRDGTTWIQDRHSTNGTAIADADGARAELNPNRRTIVPVPVSIFFGEETATLIDR